MHRWWLALLGCALTLAAVAPAAHATPVLVLDHGRVHRQQDRFLPATTLPPAPGRPASHAARRVRARASARTVKGELQRLVAAGAISQGEYNQRVASYDAARQDRNTLSGTPRRELGWVIENLDEMAARGYLTPSRLKPLFLILDRNREWWDSGVVPAVGERVRFRGSLLIFQYYRGEGLQLQPLANFGKVNGYIKGGIPIAARNLANELIALAVDRSGATAWEYYFHFGGGNPPWISGLSQGTAVQALIHAAKAYNRVDYLKVGLAGLRPFEVSPPTGIRWRIGSGAHYLIYSFAPRYRVLNAFTQALISLFDAGDPKAANSARARSLFRKGESELRKELPRYDTGRWSRYSLSGEVASVHYHTLARDFLRTLCQRSKIQVYCRYATKFTTYLRRRGLSTKPIE